MENKTGEPKSFEEKAKLYKTAVQAIAMGVGGSAEYDLRDLGSLIVQYKGLQTDEERTKFKDEKISPMYDKLGLAEKTNPKVGEAVVNMIFVESILN